MVNFCVLKIGFHGDTFVAREHNTNGIFHFSLKFWTQLMTNESLKTNLVIYVIKTTLSQKPV